HFPLELGEQHFAAWLELWRRNCRIYFATSEADEMIGIAESIGQRLRALIAYNQARPKFEDERGEPSANPQA
ncbi:MAG TPA: globin, partial [Opitutaceae bacterium]